MDVCAINIVHNIVFLLSALISLSWNVDETTLIAKKKII